MPDDSTKDVEPSPFSELDHSPRSAEPSHLVPAEFTKLLLGVGLGIAITLAATHWLKPAADRPTLTSVNSASTAATPVTLARVTVAPIQRTLAATGTVVAAEMLAILSPSSGLQIDQVLVEEGDLVMQGQVLAVLDSKVLQAQLREAEAQVQAAAAKLAELQSGSRIEEINRARAEVHSAEAAVARSESDLTLANQRVLRNQTLAREGAIATDRLDEVLNQARSAEAALSQAKATLQQATQQLSELETGPRPEVLAQAEAQLEANRQRVQTLQAQLEDTQVLAPRSGKIAERLARVGDVASGQLFSLIDNQRLELHLELPETQLAQVRLQQGVQITSDAHPNLRLSGRVQAIDPLIDPKTRMATVEVSLPDSDLLQPGMFLRGAIITSTTPGITLPAAAVLPQPDGSHLVYRLNPDQTVTAQSVEVGELLPNQQIEIKQGLTKNDRVVLKGAAYLKDGDRVEIN
ncbi:MAG: efflux RND transporter periplasmic adaptor subunit [Leptolyngbya sp. IPPAS B-1204]